MTDQQQQPDQQTNSKPSGKATNDNKKQPPQRTLEQAQQRYDDLKDQRDKQMDHAQRLLGLCALSGFISLLAKPTWETVTNGLLRKGLTYCIAALLGTVVAVFIVIFDDLWNPIKTPMLLGTGTQVQSQQSDTTTQTVTTTQTDTAAQTDQQTQTDTADQSQERSTVDESASLIKVWEEQSNKLEKHDNFRKWTTIIAYTAYTIALDGIILCLFPV